MVQLIRAGAERGGQNLQAVCSEITIIQPDEQRDKVSLLFKIYGGQVPDIQR